jgi:hypothetical protein
MQPILDSAQHHQKTLASTAAERVHDNPRERQFRRATLVGIKGFSAGVPIKNTATVYLGARDDMQPIAIAPGEEVDWSPPSDRKEALFNLWLKGAVGDGVHVLFYE